MKKKFKTGICILMAVCILAAGLYFMGRSTFGYMKTQLAQYVDQQVDQQVEDRIAEMTSEWQNHMMAETETETETSVPVTETETEAVTANAQAQTETNHEESTAELILPKVMYFRKTENSQQYNIYYKNITAGSYDIFEVVSQDGMQMNYCYRLETGKLNHMLFEVTMRLFSGSSEVVASQGLILNFVEQTSDREINLMCIGDSWTEMGTYCNRIREQMDGLNLLGVMERPGEDLPRIGHGGWSLDRFANQFMTDLDSPFLFPVGVDGSRYKGCVQTMKNIVTCDDGTYNVALYKKFARNWQDEGEYLWDDEGYYKNPQPGDVMTDSQRPDGEKYIQWDGSQWTPMEQQPEGYEFHYGKFMERFSVCFGGKAPTHVSILTGANDFTYGCNEDEVKAWIEAYMEPMIRSIHEYDPNIRILIAAGQLGADQDAFGSAFGAWISSRQYNNSMKTMVKALIHYYDDDDHKAQNIYLVPIYAMLDTDNGFSTVEEQIDCYSDETVERQNDALHPSSGGMNQVGDAFLGVLEFTR